jgi:hypothetical protein
MKVEIAVLEGVHVCHSTITVDGPCTDWLMRHCGTCLAVEALCSGVVVFTERHLKINVCKRLPAPTKAGQVLVKLASLSERIATRGFSKSGPRPIAVATENYRLGER